MFTLNIFTKVLCVCLISCACYRLSDSEWCSCLGCIHSTVSPAVTWWLHSCGILHYRNLDRVWSKKIGPIIQPYTFTLVAEIVLQPTCMCESVCYRNSAHVFISCAIVSSCLRKGGNSRTYCMYTTGTVPSSWNSVWMWLLCTHRRNGVSWPLWLEIAEWLFQILKGTVR